MAGHRRWTDEQLIAAVGSSGSYAQVVTKLGLAKSGSSSPLVRRHVERLGLSTDHFHGQAWAQGRRFPDRPRRPIEEVLVSGRVVHTGYLKQRLLNEGLKELRCERCGIEEWQGEPAPLELDHVLGDRSNNMLSNLRLLCSNCHALTPTYCGRNKGRVVESGKTRGF